MALIKVSPNRLDRAVANEVAGRARPGLEKAAGALTWCADEHVLVALAAANWLYAHLRRPAARPVANHMLTVSLVTAMVPHVLKSLFDQTRPDRLTLRGHLNGAPVSGKRRDAFPSGHAVHMGALASAAGLLPPAPRRSIRLAAVLVSLTRVVLLAHWLSDVVAGFALGALIERALRPRRMMTVSARRARS